jgi:hypothetical protein
MESLPHKLKRAENVKAILQAWMNQMNKLVDLYDEMFDKINIDEADGKLLGQIAINHGMYREVGETDDELRFRIKLQVYSQKASGNVNAISTIITDVLGISDEEALLREVGNAKVEILVDRETVNADSIASITTVMNVAKPAGVAFFITSTQVIEYLMDITHRKEVTSGGMVNYYAYDYVVATDNRFVRTQNSDAKLDFDLFDNIISVDVSSETVYLVEQDYLMDDDKLFDEYVTNTINRIYD